MRPQQRQSDSIVTTIETSIGIAVERMETIITTQMPITIVAETTVTIRTTRAGGGGGVTKTKAPRMEKIKER